MIYLKLYQDAIVYFAFVLVIAISGIVGTYNPRARKILHLRFSVDFIPMSINLWPTGITIGEMILFALYLALNSYWFWFWSTGFSYRQSTSLNADDYQDVQLYARVMGHMANLSMSLLILPVTHNSVWEAVFGVPFDRAIKYHRVLGSVAWTFVTLHMLLWQIKWLRAGRDVLANNCWESRGLSYLIISGTFNNPIEYRQTQWTIPVMEFTWLLCTLCLSLAVFFRTYKYELFQFTHFFMILFFVTGFVHSFSFWYYAASGMMLYALDKSVRMINSSRAHNIKQLQYHPEAGFTRLVFSGDIFANNFIAGQFSWICIPAVSPFEYHPFTISSAPCDAIGPKGVVNFSIKNMGPDTWTDLLAKLSEKGSEEQTFVASIDGPYGRAITYSDSSTVVLVAGGIGVTPMISILAEL